jgi:predicted XRE-type DNA-binding protein
VKIQSVKMNNKRKAFEVKTSAGVYGFPYIKTKPAPGSADPVARVYVDKEIASEGFSYELKSGKTGTVHVDQVLEYNREPNYLRDLLLYKLTLEAQKRIANHQLAKREIIRRLGTSATQLYRLLDQTNYKKSVDQLVSLLQVLDCQVDLVVRAKSA